MKTDNLTYLVDGNISHTFSQNSSIWPNWTIKCVIVYVEIVNTVFICLYMLLMLLAHSGYQPLDYITRPGLTHPSETFPSGFSPKF